MTKSFLPDYIFEVSWEVCNKVGGIYTVLSSAAKTLEKQMKGHVIFIGPDNVSDKSDFKEDVVLSKDWESIKEQMPIRVGRWLVPGNPIAILVEYKYLYDRKNDFYKKAWDLFGVDSLHAYGDYDESSMFSIAAAMVAEKVYKEILCKEREKKNVVYQAHEWMSGLGMLYIKHNVPQISTIFTTHATSIGRSIVSNEKQLYKYLHDYDGDIMADELNMQSKHSVEKRSAHEADCFTTVSQLTNKECEELLDKSADVVLPNGFETDFVPKGNEKKIKRTKARKVIIEVAKTLMGEIDDDVLILSTSGRNDYRCKGFDVYLEMVSQLRQSKLDKDVLALIEVPCWTKEPRKDLLEKLAKGPLDVTKLPEPYITHWLYNMEEDRILNTLRYHGLLNQSNSRVKVLLIPCYLDGKDGVFNIGYYDMLTACDLCIYPSYYEPWGYTPLESAAFGIPTITTNLAGFGLWAEEQGIFDSIEQGVCVINRTDDNYFDSVRQIKDCVLDWISLSTSQKAKAQKAAAALVQKATWTKFIKNYKEAFLFAMNRSRERNRQ